MAWRKLAVVLGNQLIDLAGQIEATTKAYQLRDRLPERERLLATALYHENVTGNFDAAIGAYVQLLEKRPDDETALNNLAIEYNVKHRYADAERIARKGLESSPTTAVLWFNLNDALIYQGRFAAAESAHRELTRQAPQVGNRFQIGFMIAVAKGDYRQALAWADSLGSSEEPAFRAVSRRQKANVYTITGRLTAAGREYDAAREQFRGRGLRDQYLFAAADKLLLDAVVRDRPEAARHAMDSILAREPLDSLAPANRPYLGLARFYAKAGDPGRAERYYQAWEKDTPPERRNALGFPSFVRGWIAVARSRPAEAIPFFRKGQEIDGCVLCGLGEIGEAFDELQQPDSALAAYEALVTVPSPGAFGRPLNLAPALRRLGELYETKGNRTKAADYYTRFIDLWREADPDLQPRVAKVKQRLAEVVGEPKS
jgi:tetratricopeptide (TPR) repeat protein